MSGETRAADVTLSTAENLRLGLFAVALSVLLAAIMLLFRTGLPTPLLPLIAGPCILAGAILLPVLAKPGVWAGPLCALALLAGCLITGLGLAGIILLSLAAAGCIVVAVRRVAQASPKASGRLAAWIGMLVLSALLSTLLIHGNKYLNFVADQLLLWGRTDGDIMFHGAITNAYRYFHFPSTGVDGLNWLRYHTGIDALGALIATGSQVDAVFGLMVLRTLILFPLMVFAAALGALTLGRALLPQHRISAFAALLATVFVALLLQAGSIGLTFAPHNDPMLLSAVLVFLLAPAVIVELSARGEQARLALVAAALAIPLLAVAKVSTGAIWCAFAGFLILRTVGPRRGAFWIAGGVMLLLFAVSAYVTSGATEPGAVWFGTPFFVEYGFAKGDYLIPLRLHAVPLLAVLGLLWLVPASSAQRRPLMEAIIAAAFAANVVGLVLQIPGSDAVFFFFGVTVLAMLPLVALIASAPHIIGGLVPSRRRISAALGIVLILGAFVDAGLRVDDGAQQAISATALLKTGDLTYYAADRRKVWREDTRRAMREIGISTLFGLEGATPRGAGLRDALVAAKQEAPGVAVYIRPQSDFWSFIPDCDGRSVWTMASAGVPMIDGYVPVQAECPQEFGVSGYGKPPEVRTDFSDAEVCQRANAKGITDVLIVEAVEDRSRDRRLACR